MKFVADVMLSYAQNENDADSQISKNLYGITMDKAVGGDYVEENDDPSSIRKIIYGNYQ